MYLLPISLFLFLKFYLMYSKKTFLQMNDSNCFSILKIEAMNSTIINEFPLDFQLVCSLKLAI